MPLSCYVPSQIIPQSRVVHLADKQISKRHILSYLKIPPEGVGWVCVCVWGGGGSIPCPWTIAVSTVQMPVTVKATDAHSLPGTDEFRL